MSDDVGLRTFEAAMKIADLWIVERRPNPQEEGTTIYRVAPDRPPPAMVTCTVRVLDDSMASGWAEAARCVNILSGYVPDFIAMQDRVANAHNKARRADAK